MLLYNFVVDESFLDRLLFNPHTVRAAAVWFLSEQFIFIPLLSEVEI